MKPWWERFPAVYEEELAQLEAAGIPFTRDEAQWAAGVLQLWLHPTIQGRDIELVATYPDLYPYFRFEVRAPEERQLIRHRDPFGGVLCLVGRGGENWEVDDRLAWFIENQVPKVLRLGEAGADPEELAAGEEHQGEPFSEYYPYLQDALLVIDSAWELPAGVESGTLGLLVEPRSDGIVRGVVAEVRDGDGDVVCRYPAPQAVYSQPLEARWFRVPSVIQESDPERALGAVAEIHDEARRSRPQRLGPMVVDVHAVIFPEEIGWRQGGNGWFFVVRGQAAKQPKQKRPPSGYYFARAGRAGVTDLVQRIPELEPLREKTIAIIGLGGLGAPSALEFARAQVGTLRLCDHDFVDPGTSVRWPLGIAAAGISKVRLGSFIEQQWPFVKAQQFAHRLGGIPGAEDQRDLDFVDAFLDGVDLVYDTSADLGIQYFLSEQARERQIAYIALDATFGAWGGKVVRVVPGVTKGCWLCSRAAFEAGVMDLPPADPNGDVQTTGCADVTFAGSAFDLLPVVAAGVRLAVSTLESLHSSGYPELDWDVGVLSLRTADGAACPGTWTTHPLETHPQCPVCGD